MPKLYGKCDRGHKLIARNGFPSKKRKIFYGYIVVAIALIITAAIYGTVFTFGVFIEPILADFGWGSAVLSGSLSVAIFISGFLGIFAGRLSDRFGPKKIVLACNLFFGLGYLLMSQVNSIWQLYLFFGVFVGIGMSAGIAPLQSTVVKWFIEKRGLMVAISLMGMTGGNMIMPPIANWLILLHGWRIAFIILGTVSFAIVFVVSLFLKSSPAQIGQVPYGAEDMDGNESTPRHITGLSFRESLYTTQLWLLCAFFFCISFAHLIIMTHIVPHAINQGISPTISASILVVIGVAATAARIPVGFLADRIGIRKTAIIIIALWMSSYVWISLTGDSVWSLFTFAVIVGLASSSLDILLALFVSDIFGMI
ncbi:MAG: MFS transporter, partial [Anaerolineales bacterium]|nr:MFS transporter [Anaerolineales bacterium]